MSRSRPKPSPIDAAPQGITLTAADAAIVARALNEASARHVQGFDRKFREDADVGRKMMALLQSRFPDARDAFERAETLRTAIAVGFLPPETGDLMSTAKAFLADHEDAEKAAREVRRRNYDLGDDLPF